MDDILIKLFSIAEKRNINVHYIPLANKDGCAVKLKNEYAIGINKKINGDIRLKYTLAEELGHCCTNSFYILNSPPALLKLNKDKAERQAKDWTIKTLIPLDSLISSLKDNFGDLYHVAEDFDTNIDFVNESIDYYTRKSLLPTAEELGLYEY